MVNDPCDEWPRVLIFRAVGLRDCGHPRPGHAGPVSRFTTGSICPFCDRNDRESRAWGGQSRLAGGGADYGRKVERAPGAE